MVDEVGAYLHWSFQNDHILFEALRLNSIWSFILASLLTGVLCLSERLLTFALNKNWNPFHTVRRSRWRNAMWRTSLFWITTIIRLVYMLVVMSYNIGLILVTATSLAAGQFIIELLESPLLSTEERITEPLLHSNSHQHVALKSITTRPRSRSKPTEIFIHPHESNLARADAVAQELGLFGDTEMVKANIHPRAEESLGNGKEIARSLLGGPRQSQEHLFRIADDQTEGSDTDSL